jgi:tol-pal system protein YbgF
MRATLLAALALAAAVGLAGGARAQNAADIRAELTVLDGQIQQLRDELVRSGAAGGLPADPATALTRLDQLEAELRRLTSRVEVLTNDIARIVEDATNRVGDIEFRLTELEGGDTGALGKPEPLGGGVTALAPLPRPEGMATPQAPAPAGAAPGSEMTVTEQSDFDAAVAAATAGDHARAAQLFETFLATYPGGPLSSEAQFRRGEALAAQSDWRAAAQSYLDAFSGAPHGPYAPRSLYRLAVSLAEIGQPEEACLTLLEVDSRYPGSDVAGEVAAQKQVLRCP